MRALHHQVGSGCRKPQDPVRARVGKGAVLGPWASRRPVTTGSGSWASQGTVEELRSGGLAGISWFRRGGGGGSRERAPRQSRVPETGEGIGPGARWRLGRLRGLERRCLATGRSADARPRSRSASPCPRPPGHFCSARPRPDPRFHAVRVQNDAGKRVGVLGPGSVQGVEGGRAGSAEPVRLRASGL